MKVFTLITAGVLAAVSLSAETIKYDLNKFVQKNRSNVAGDVMTYKDHGILQLNKIKFDPKAKYTFSFDCKSAPNKKAPVFYAGFFSFDKNGRQIYHHNVTHVPNSLTVLTKAVKKGDKTIAIKDGSKWRKSTYIAFNAKKDLSDLPNYNVFGGITKVEKKGNEWILTFNKPLNKAYPAGTAVRNHRPGGYIYTSVGTPAAAWKAITGFKQGVNKLDRANNILNFWPGTVTIQPMILMNWNFSQKGTATQLRNVKLTITK